ncbi:MAG: 30S ribosomal protein S27ae [Candidatus Poseidoniales archaeon]|nr:30S ribosomal protein S27ae [Candidatus Poseidoniales archaeon]
MSNRGQLYVVEGDKLVRKNEFCPRCGPGVFLATHHDRRSCGRCGYRLDSLGDVAPSEAEASPEEPADAPTESPAEEAPAEEPAEAPSEEAADPEV